MSDSDCFFLEFDAVVCMRIAVSRIALVSPERSRQIESILLRMVQQGRFQGKVTENQLIELLEQVGVIQNTT